MGAGKRRDTWKRLYMDRRIGLRRPDQLCFSRAEPMNSKLFILGLSLLLAGKAGSAVVNEDQPTASSRPSKIVLIAGPLDKGHPAGTHEYEKSVRLLKHCLDRSPDARGIVTQAYTGGWPDDPRTLDDADTIVLIASGSDRLESDH